MVSKTASVRLDEELYTRIDEYCVTQNCSRNDFIKSAIESELDKKPEPAPLKVSRVSYDDGKTWIDVN